MGLKSLFLAVCIAVIAGCASQPKLTEMASTASLALSLGRWILKDDKEVFAVEVQAKASTRESAERELFMVTVAHDVQFATERAHQRNRAHHEVAKSISDLRGGDWVVPQPWIFMIFTW